jgi:hypothetical protein
LVSAVTVEPHVGTRCRGNELGGNTARESRTVVMFYAMGEASAVVGA